MSLIDKAQDAEMQIWMWLAPLIILGAILGFFGYEPPPKPAPKPRPSPSALEKAGEFAGKKSAEAGRGFVRGVISKLFGGKDE